MRSEEMTVELLETALAFGGEQRKYRHDSEVLQCAMTFSLYLPSNSENKELPLLWWLSGLTCTDDNFSQKSGFQRLAEKYQMAVVIPDTSPRGADVADDTSWDLGQGAGFYVDATEMPWAKNYQMYTYLTQELSEVVKPLIPNFSGKESITGHSMGGHGAFVLGLKNAARFQSISAFAPILNPMQVPWGKKALTAYLGDNQATWKNWDASELIKTAPQVPILIMQGEADGFYETQLKETTFLANALENNRKVDYQKIAGYDHSYFFISTFLEEHFSFHAKYLK